MDSIITTELSSTREAYKVLRLIFSPQENIKSCYILENHSCVSRFSKQCNQSYWRISCNIFIFSVVVREFFTVCFHQRWENKHAPDTFIYPKVNKRRMVNPILLKWSRVSESNRPPVDYKSTALPNELTRHNQLLSTL